MIEHYKLYEFDSGQTGTDPVPDIDSDFGDELAVQNVNNVNYVVATGNESALDIALNNDLYVRTVLKYNEKISNADQIIAKGTRVFLQKKRNGYWGKRKWHIVKKGETMFDLSQKYGVCLKKLNRRNRVGSNEEPRTGQRIKLRGWRILKKKAPKTIAKPQEDLPEPGEIDFIDLGSEGENESEGESFDPATSNENEEDLPPFEPDIGINPQDDVEEEPPLIEEEEDEEPTPPPPVVIDDDHNAPPTADPVYYVVQKGDNLYRISRWYGVTVDELKSLNNLTSNIIRKGQRLRVH